MADSGKWTKEKIPEQSGRLAVVTGANSGIGYEAALALAGRGAHVVLAARSTEKGEGAAARIRQVHPAASVEPGLLDLADLASIERFAEGITARHARIDLLINNAGVMAIPFRRTTDGFEMQFGTNHLGHFALTARLLDPLLAAPAARVVHVSSGAHTRGRLDLDRVNDEEGYSRFGAYSGSKLANLLFAYELERRFRDAGAAAISVGCHPGYAATNLQAAGPEMTGSRVQATFMSFLNWLVAQGPDMGALPTLYAAVAPEVNGCDYIGPDGLMGMRGHPTKVRSTDHSYDPQLAAELWSLSESLTGLTYDALAGSRQIEAA